MKWQPGDMFIYKAVEEDKGDGSIAQILELPPKDESAWGEYYKARFIDGPEVGAVGLFFEEEMQPIRGWVDAPNTAHGKVFYSE